jgi:hypothetical protein
LTAPQLEEFRWFVRAHLKAPDGSLLEPLPDLHAWLGTTTVYVTHDQVEAMTLGDRVAVMHEGRVQQVEVPHRLYNDPVNAFVAAFIGSPPMNLVLASGRVPEPSSRSHLCRIEEGPRQPARKLPPSSVLPGISAERVVVSAYLMVPRLDHRDVVPLGGTNGWEAGHPCGLGFHQEKAAGPHETDNQGQAPGTWVKQRPCEGAPAPTHVSAS